MGLLKRCVSVAAPLIPYIAVTAGMFGLHSAWAALLIYHAGMFAVVVTSGEWGGYEPKQSLQWWVIPTILIYSLGGTALYILWPYINPGPDAIAGKLAGYGIDRQTWPCFAVYFCVANPLLEELFWRGSLWTNTLRPTANDFLFGGYHAFVLLAFTSPVWTLPTVVCCAFAGWLWRALRSWTHGLAVPVATHMVADVAIAVAVSMRAFS